jgi:hypothetical protein
MMDVVAAVLGDGVEVMFDEVEDEAEENELSWLEFPLSSEKLN